VNQESSSESKSRPDSPPRGAPAGARKRLHRIAGVLVASALLFVLLEGASSIALATYRTVGPSSVGINVYDTLLGWTGRPLVDLPAHWGWRRGVHTNSRGFRGTEEIEAEEPAGRLRVLCLGDSFVFGDGVDDRDAWCHRLGVVDSTLQTINLALPGYGVGQAYLRYERDAEPFEHSIVLFAFIGDDFVRLGLRSRNGYAKPLLRAAGEGVEATHVPPPRALPAIGRTVTRWTEHLRLIELANRGLARPFRALADRRASTDPDLERVATNVFRATRALVERRGGAVLFAYLPTLHDVDADLAWRARATEILDGLGYPFVDLTDSLRSVPPALRSALFLPPGDPAQGHYSVSGNSWVAGELHRVLVERGFVPGPTPDGGESGPAAPPARTSARPSGGR